MREEMASEAGTHQGSKRSRIRCIVIGVTFISLVALGIVLALVLTNASDEPPGLLVYPDNFIYISRSKPVTDYLDSLNNFARSYDIFGVDGSTLAECSFSSGRPAGAQCLFRLEWLNMPCWKSEDWGYKNLDPCIILVLNQPRNWIPEVYTSLDELPASMPQHLVQHIQVQSESRNGEIPKMLWVSCSGMYPADEEFLGEVRMSPWKGFPSFYFPLRDNTSHLATPVIGLHLADVEPHVLIHIKCFFWAKNLESPYLAAEIEFLRD